MDQASASAQPYRVLARTYRPQRLSALIGQEALVRTLTNAMHSGRIAHAFLLSGIRGIGKTTTARIIAKGLNCTGPDGKGGPTPEPCGECPSCRSLIEERPLDVIEMDAATRTGIDDIREIVDAVRYAPASSRYKIYIIDEVHMLSEKAFNGLLKTLEEPPPHAKFIFATTEVRKLPVTVLSRCQRFDLKRVEPAVLEAHLTGIAEQEQVSAEPEAHGAHRPGRRGLGARRALAARSGDRLERRAGHGGNRCRHARARRSATADRLARGSAQRRGWETRSISSASCFASVPSPWQCCRICSRSAIG